MEEGGIKCLITKKELKELWFRDKAYEMDKPSVDKIKNDENYSVLNCEFIEMVDNSKKSHIDNPQGKHILQYDLKGNFIREWNSITEASKYYNVTGTALYNCLHQFCKKSCGFIWRYKNAKS